MRGIAIFLSFLLFPTIANAYEAPFGLRWGMTVDELLVVVGLRNVGKLTKSNVWPGMIELHFINAPRTPSNTDFFTGEFTDEAGLISISWTSTDITTDGLGNEGYEYYLELKSIVSEKYKPEKTDEHIYRGDIQLDDEPYRLYECLAFDACGKYTTSYSLDDGGSIEVKLLSRSQPRLFATIKYNAANWFTSVMENFIRAQRQQGKLTEEQEKAKQLDKKAF